MLKWLPDSCFIAHTAAQRRRVKAIDAGLPAAQDKAAKIVTRGAGLCLHAAKL